MNTYPPNKLPLYSKKSPEYISNGHYLIDGKEYMSVWTYKNNYVRFVENCTELNVQEGRSLSVECSSSFYAKPDKGPFKKVLIFPVDELYKFFYDYF
jgi:hypothetical protein